MPVSGKKMMEMFERAGWIKVRQKGSHVTVSKGNRSIVIPMHKELKKGLEAYLKKILKEG